MSSSDGHKEWQTHKTQMQHIFQIAWIQSKITSFAVLSNEQEQRENDFFLNLGRNEANVSDFRDVVPEPLPFEGETREVVSNIQQKQHTNTNNAICNIRAPVC